MRTVRILCVLGLLFSVSSASAEEVETRVSAVAAGEVHLAPEFSGNGIVVVQAELNHYRIRLNTDTLDLSGLFEVSDDTTVRVGLAGEAFAAGVFTNYYQAGELVRRRAFSATWGAGYVEIERAFSRHLFLQWRPQVRTWRFGRGTGGDRLIVPVEFTSIENKLNLTYWNFEPDRSQWQAHRLFQRLAGFGAGVEGEFWWRSQAARWGHPSDPRNPPERLNLAITQWAILGAGSDDVRAQLSQRLRVGFDEDDINRARVGGFNPYTVPLAGVGWPAFLTSRYLSGRGSLHINVGGESEAGVAVDGVMLQDPLRDGNSGYGAFGGVSTFLDLRVDEWQFDAHFGWTLPSPLLARGPQLGAFVALGRRL